MYLFPPDFTPSPGSQTSPFLPPPYSPSSKLQYPIGAIISGYFLPQEYSAQIYSLRHFSRGALFPCFLCGLIACLAAALGELAEETNLSHFFILYFPNFPHVLILYQDLLYRPSPPFWSPLITFLELWLMVPQLLRPRFQLLVIFFIPSFPPRFFPCEEKHTGSCRNSLLLVRFLFSRRSTRPYAFLLFSPSMNIFPCNGWVWTAMYSRPKVERKPPLSPIPSFWESF